MSRDSRDSRESRDSRDTQERRRERRLRFTRRCNLIVKSPTWAMTPEPLSGTTVNLTSTGVKISNLMPPPGHFSVWSGAIDAFKEVEVEVRLPELPGFPALPGQLAWVMEQPATQPGYANTVSVGIFFSVMRDAEQAALMKLIKAVERETGAD